MCLLTAPDRLAVLDTVSCLVVADGGLCGFGRPSVAVAFHHIDYILGNARYGGRYLFCRGNSLGEPVGNPVKHGGVAPREFGFQRLEDLCSEIHCFVL